MKNLVQYFLIVICAFSLMGCNNKDKGSVTEQLAGTIENKGAPPQNPGADGSITGQNTKEPDTYEPVTGDDLSVGVEFAGDLASENFTRLIKAYSYDEKMKAAIASVETRKTVMFYNSEYGELIKINEPYILSRGAYQYVCVPVESSINNFNYQIAFDGNHNIVGFTFREYVPKVSPEEDTIPSGVMEEEYTFNSDGFVIPGTFTAPDMGGHYPVVILVQGSGPSNRDESIYENKPFRDIAWALARGGIASYRFDKRSYLYGQQMNEDVTVTIQDEITNDVIAAAVMVKNLEKADPSGIFILGHSLSGYVLPRLADKLPDASGYILMAAPAQHIKEYIYDQYEYLAEEDEIITKEEQQQLDTLEKEIAFLNNPKDIPDNRTILGAHRDYWKDLSAYYPIKMARSIKKPVLVLQGERDYQVNMKQYNIWKENFEDKENWFFKSYATLNHFMMPGYGKSYTEEYKKKTHVDDEVMQDIIQFIKNSRK